MGSTIYLWEVVFIYHFILGNTEYFEKSSMLTILFWGALYILKSSQCLPFYIGEHCIFMRNCLQLPFYFGSKVYFWEVVFFYHLIWGALNFLKSRQCLPFYIGEHCIFTDHRKFSLGLMLPVFSNSYYSKKILELGGHKVIPVNVTFSFSVYLKKFREYE